MTKIYESGRFLTSAYRMIRFCLFAVTVGPMCHKTAAQEFAVTPVTPLFSLLDSPLWLDSDQRVYLIESINKQLIGYTPDLLSNVTLDTNNPLKFVVHIFNQTAFAVGYGHDVGVFPWNGTSTDTVASTNSLSLSNDDTEFIECGKGDANGLLWIGTSYQTTVEAEPQMRGRFYSVDGSGKKTVHVENVGVPGGITWSPDYKRFYYTDRKAKTIIGSSFDVNLGVLNNDGAVVYAFDTDHIKGNPNGLTVDTNGHLWVACWKSTTIVKIDPVAGILLKTIDFPGTSSISSVEFGSTGLADLYVTTAANQASDPGGYENAGALFKVANTNATGVGGMDIVVNWPKIKP